MRDAIISHNIILLWETKLSAPSEAFLSTLWWWNYGLGFFGGHWTIRRYYFGVESKAVRLKEFSLFEFFDHC